MPASYAVKDRQDQQVSSAANVETRSLSNGHSPRASVQERDNDLIAQQRIDEWLSENEYEDELERRATWQKIVTHKTPTITFSPRAFAAVDTSDSRLSSSPSPNATLAPAPAFPPLPVTPPINHEPPRHKRRMVSIPRLSSWITVLVLLALLLGGAFGIFVSLGYYTPPKSTSNTMSLRVSPSTISFGGTITLRGSHFSPNGQVGLFRDSTIPLLDTAFKTMIRADATGSFEDTVAITGNWTAGSHTIRAEDARLHKSASYGIQVTGHAMPSLPAHLQISPNSVDLGSGDQATNATQSITLQNGGGEQISWQATTTRPSWLLLSPQSGTLAGGQKMSVTVAGERSNLKVGMYNADVIFTWDSVPIMLPVQMKVTPLEKGHEAILQATPAVLSFSAVDGGLNPSAQVVTISNPGLRPLNWSASTTTTDGANWLSASPQSGSVATGAGQPVTISVNSSALLPGVYYGAITFNSQGSEAVQNSSQTIYVSVTIQPQCSIQVSPGAITFTAVYLQPAPGSKAIGIDTSQSCSAPLSWSVSASTNNGGSWLAVSTAGGTTPSSPSVSINVAGIQPGTYSGQLLFSSSAGTQTVPVTLVMGNPTTPIMSASAALLKVRGVSGQPTPTPQTIVLTNTGGGTLSWKASATTVSGGAWLSVNPFQGSLLQQQPTSLSISATTLSGMIPGVYNGTITITGSDGAGHTALGSPQSIAVTFTVQAPCTIAASVPSLTFQGVAGQPAPATQPVAISASGACAHTLSWTASAATTPAGGTWLTATPATGTISLSSPSSTAVGVSLTGLAANTYTGSVTISAIDSVSQVPIGKPQVVTITLNVLPPCTLQAPSVTAETFASEAGLNPATQTFTIGVIGTCMGKVTVTPTATMTGGGTWLSVSPASATATSKAPATFTVTVTSAALAAGQYSGAISLAGVDNSGITITGSPQSVALNLTVAAPPVLAVSPATLTFTQATGPSTQSITVSNTGGEPLKWTAVLAPGAPSYVTISSKASGTLAAGAKTTVSVTVDTTNVPGGTNASASVTISAIDPLTNATVSGSPASVNITISTPPASMHIGTNTLNFTTTAGTDPAPQTISLSNSGGNGLTWTVGTPTSTWLSVSPTSGSGAATLTFSINAAGLTANTYTATVTITPSTGTAVTVTVNLTVN